MENCIFCKIVRGEMPSAKVYEDEAVMAFLDIMPANKGHCLVVPKTHHERMDVTPDEKLHAVMSSAKKVAKAVSQAVGNPGYNIIINNGPEANQTVPHLHLHIIPRHDGDDRVPPWKHMKYAEGEMDEVRKNIRSFLK